MKKPAQPAQPSGPGAESRAARRLLGMGADGGFGRVAGIGAAVFLDLGTLAVRCPFAPGGVTGFWREIHVVPHQVNLDPLLRNGTAFSFDSNYRRRNPVAAVDAFMRAFSPLDEDCRLFVRCQESVDFGELYDHLVSYAAGDPRIHVFDVASQPWPIGEFLASLDVFISLHRSEGYGLQIAEAAQAGVPVLATAWGLAPDIAVRPEVRSIGYRLVSVLDPQRFYTGLSGARWAEPDIDDAVRWLRRLREMHHATITGRRSGLGGRLDMSNRHTFPQ